MRQIAFQAHWTPQNCHLQSHFKGIFQSQQLSLYQKITLAFHRILESLGRHFCPPHVQSLIRYALIPSSLLTGDLSSRMEQEWIQKWEGPDAQGQWTQLRNAYTPIQMKLKTPDGIPVDGIFYQSRATAERDIPTILCFTGNGGVLYSPSWDWLLKKGMQSTQPFNVIAVNYAMPDLKSAKDPVICGETIFQAARESLGISEANLHFLGFSLGGAVAALVHDLHPWAGRMINYNSFDSLRGLIRSPASPLCDMIPHWLLRELLAQATVPLGWNMEPKRALRQLKEKTLFIYNPQDEIIPPDATAARATASLLDSIFRRHAVLEASDHVIPLKLGNRRARPSSHHNAPLGLYEDGNGCSVSNRIVNFLLGRDIFPRRQTA
jgi:hypothetical protein